MRCIQRLLCLVLSLGFALCEYNVSLEEVSTVYLPNNGRIWNVDASDSASYDADNKLLYVVGGLYRTVIDMSNPSNLAPLRSDMSPQGNVEYTDVDVCGNLFIQTTIDDADLSRGKVEIFRKFEASTPTRKLHVIDVDGDPTAVRFLPGCKFAIVVTRGSAYGTGSSFVDPIGKIYLIRVPAPCPSGSCKDATELNFKDFDTRFDELSSSGVRFVYRDNSNNFSNDADPLRVTMSADSKTAYVGLQRSNAIAVVDLPTFRITGVYGLGMKDWSKLKMDASDRDGGIHMMNWCVYSYYLPDGLDYMTHGGKNYIVTANEGDDYDYDDLIGWKEEMRGREFVEKNMTAFDLSPGMKMCLANDSMLGRLRFTTENGENNTDGYRKFVMLGSRSFSIWDASTLSLVYDSGDVIESHHAHRMPEIFNADVNATDTPSQNVDLESQKRGPEPESIAVGSVDRLSLIFVGNESPGSLCVYSILDDVTKPRCEFMWNGIKNTSQTWESQFSDKTLRGIGPGKLIFIPAGDSQTEKPALIVVGSGSSSVTLFNVILSGTVPPASSGENIHFSRVLLMVMFLVNIFFNGRS